MTARMERFILSSCLRDMTVRMSTHTSSTTGVANTVIGGSSLETMADGRVKRACVRVTHGRHGRHAGSLRAVAAAFMTAGRPSAVRAGPAPDVAGSLEPRGRQWQGGIRRACREGPDASVAARRYDAGLVSLHPE